MQNIEEFEAWIKANGGQKGLAALFKKRFGKNVEVSQTAISNWLSRRKIPTGDRRDQLFELGWKGPYEWPIDQIVTREEFNALSDDVEDACEVIRFLLSAMPPGSRPGVLPKRFR